VGFVQCLYKKTVTDYSDKKEKQCACMVAIEAPNKYLYKYNGQWVEHGLENEYFD
jgi:hypothetical protein